MRNGNRDDAERGCTACGDRKTANDAGTRQPGDRLHPADAFTATCFVPATVKLIGRLTAGHAVLCLARLPITQTWNYAVTAKSR